MTIRALLICMTLALLSGGCKLDEGYFNRRIEELDRAAARAGPEARKKIERKKAELKEAFDKLPQKGREQALHELGRRAKEAVTEAEGLLAAQGQAARKAEAAGLARYRKTFVGTWKGEGMLLAIDASGQVYYERGQGSVIKRKITAPITEFQRERFKVGLAGIGITFRIDRPPRVEGGAWRMKIDGVELTRVDETGKGQPAPGATLCSELKEGQCTEPRTEFGLEVEKLHLVYVTPGIPRKGQKYNVAWIAEDVGKAAPANFQIAQTDMVYDGKDQDRATYFTVTAHLSRPTAGWPPGSYRLEVRHEGKLVQTLRFRMGPAPAEPAK